MRARRWIRGTAVGGAVAALAYVGVATGAVTVDVGVGRRMRKLSVSPTDIQARREVVFEVLAEPYLGRQTRSVAEKITVLERGSDMVLAAHRTRVGAGLVAVTVETVRFTRPERVEFRLVRGPVPHVVEQFLLSERDGGCVLEYTGELGTDGWAAGACWGQIVARRWETVVADTVVTVKAEAERRARR
ncbi:hypothetical protein Raf01_77240 [Rugosimonospora africana]|uniref:Polyketide cyclase / dehydrase and lipid transport n=2 Tax=Rugosimonospora africana TaxID=556532 RepID=A0A8J3R0H8_9ACTN|nr:hypothetical protein Raf01_77240 [Rugosimonospora africana]